MHNALLCPARKPAFCGKVCILLPALRLRGQLTYTFRLLTAFAPEGVSIKNPPALFVQRDILFYDYCSAMAFSTAFCRSVTEMVHSAFRSASVPSAESLPISTAFLPFR